MTATQVQLDALIGTPYVKGETDCWWLGRVIYDAFGLPFPHAREWATDEEARQRELADLWEPIEEPELLAVANLVDASLAYVVDERADPAVMRFARNGVVRHPFRYIRSATTCLYRLRRGVA